MTRALCLLAQVFAIGLLSLGCLAADNPPAQDSNPEIRRKLAEIERLKADLQKAEAELRQLQPQLVPASPVATGAEPASTPPAGKQPSDLPPLTLETAVALDELAAHFRSDPTAARVRYYKQTFLLRATITRFQPKVARRNYELVFEPAERVPLVIGQFDYEPRFRAVYTRDNGQSLYARIHERAESLLLRAGDRVLMRGRCVGLKNGAVRFDRCTIVGN
jgi:hypothetical protein